MAQTVYYTTRKQETEVWGQAPEKEEYIRIKQNQYAQKNQSFQFEFLHNI